MEAPVVSGDGPDPVLLNIARLAYCRDCEARKL